MTAYAQIGRIFDEHIVTWEQAVGGCGWHCRHGILLRREAPWDFKSQWPEPGLPVVVVGTYTWRELVMFGICQSTGWESYHDPRGYARYRAQLSVCWENWIYRVRPADYPTLPPIGRTQGLTKVQFDAWHAIAEPVQKIKPAAVRAVA